MAYGMLVGDNLVVLTDAAHGKPVVETEEPQNIPAGYVSKGVWVDTGTQLMLVYDIVPEEGTPQEAALALSRLQFRSLPDEAAYQFRALADAYIPGETYYGPDDPSGMPQSRVLWEGQLYKCIQTHVAQQGVQVMQPGWNPVAAPSLWAQILPGQDGTVGEWVQPGSTNGYSKGDQVTHNGHKWESTADNNVWEPGAVGAPWTDLGEVSA